ncbi:MAG: preprotein translocase subunit YajC [Salinivirgaceae bacterium]|jgi:preprotein translocase subunit YajC|nr:preprotein translocase subunit YajC [Salinivirgaceae bacterium]
MNILLMATDGEAGGLASFLPLLVIVVIFYFFMIRPQMKRQKEAKKFRESISKGDKVLTIGGIYGKVTDVSDNQVTLEIADNTRVKVDKTALVKDTTELANASR